MTTISLSEPKRWLELRDERGKLCARLETHDLLLEIRRNDRTAMFDLRDYIDFVELRGRSGAIHAASDEHELTLEIFPDHSTGTIRARGHVDGTDVAAMFELLNE